MLYKIFVDKLVVFYHFGKYKSVKFEFPLKSCLNKVLSYSFVATRKPSKILKRPLWLFAITRVIPDFFHLQALLTGSPGVEIARKRPSFDHGTGAQIFGDFGEKMNALNERINE